jgi:hypothetical protein
MKRFFRAKPWLAYLIFVIADLLCVGAGMGVPIFCILLGFPVGWYLTRRHLTLNQEIKVTLKKALRDSLITAGITFALMAVIWGHTVTMLFDPAADFVNFGIPMILYEPETSFVGWLVLMIFVSPFLQLLTTIFAAYLTVTRRLQQSPRIR